MLSASWRRATSCALVISLSMFLVGTVAGEPVTVFSGKVLGAAGASPREGVVVRLVGATPEASYASRPTGSDGSFRLEGAPPGSYRVLAETEEGAYLAADGFELATGANRPVALTLAAASPDSQTTPEDTPTAPPETPTAPPATPTATTPPAAQPSGLPTWAKWTIVGGIGLVALWAIDSVTEDEDEEVASPM